MGKSVHLICRRDDGVTLNGLTRVDGFKARYRSCCWVFDDAEVAALVGGWIYLHEKKSSPSEFGGEVVAIEPTKREGRAHTDGFAVTFEARTEGRGQPWRGARHGMASKSGFVDLSFPHEVGPTR